MCIRHNPHIPSNGRVAGTDRIPVTHAYVGSCTNGRISDLRDVARILRGRKIADHVQMIVVPATQAIWKQAAQEGLLEIFVDAGASVSYPSCGACLGMHSGVLGPDDVCISSSNRNFVGRMGDPSAQIYLASPATVAASAVEGYIADPRRYDAEGNVTNDADLISYAEYVSLLTCLSSACAGVFISFFLFRSRPRHPLSAGCSAQAPVCDGVLHV